MSEKRNVVFQSTTILNGTYFYEVEDYLFSRKNRIIAQLCLCFIGIVEALTYIYMKNWISVYGCSKMGCSYGIYFFSG